jgi:hypothetical protein
MSFGHCGDFTLRKGSQQGIVIALWSASVYPTPFDPKRSVIYWSVDYVLKQWYIFPLPLLKSGML